MKERVHGLVRRAAYQIGTKTLDSVSSQRQAENFLIVAARLQYARGLKRAGRDYFGSVMVPKFLRGEPFPLSGEIALFDGFHIEKRGEEKLAALRGKPFILVANHYKKGPLEEWHVMATSHVVKKHTDQELRWVMGEGEEMFHPLIEESGLHDRVAALVTGVHKRIATSTNTIFDSNGSTLREITYTIKVGEPIGLCPERKMTVDLEKGDSDIGALIAFLTRRYQIPVICAGAFRANNSHLILQFSEPMMPDEIQKANAEDITSGKVKDQGESVITAVMERLRDQLPQELHGYYAKRH